MVKAVLVADKIFCYAACLIRRLNTQIRRWGHSGMQQSLNSSTVFKTQREFGVELAEYLKILIWLQLNLMCWALPEAFRNSIKELIRCQLYTRVWHRITLVPGYFWQFNPADPFFTQGEGRDVGFTFTPPIQNLCGLRLCPSSTVWTELFGCKLIYFESKQVQSQ